MSHVTDQDFFPDDGDADDQRIQQQLAELDSQSMTQRASYLTQLGWSRLGKSTPGIEKFLSDRDPMVRVAAAQALWQTAADRNSLDRLVRLLAAELSEEDEELALMAGTALVNLGELAVPILIDCFDNDDRKNPLVVRVIGELGGGDAMRFLRQQASSADQSVAAEASEALQALHNEGMS